MRVVSVLLALSLLVPPTIGRAQTLEGAIDFHAHAAPDGTPRKLDALELARMAKAAGMRAIVIKNHYEPTASLAYVVRKAVPGIEVFGGISLDLTVGGVNPAAVEWMTKVEGGYGKVVWLPTFDSESQVKLSGQQRPFAPVTRDGKILPEVLAVIALAAQHDLVLEMGHSAPQESLLIIRRGETARRGARARDARDEQPRRIHDARRDARSRDGSARCSSSSTRRSTDEQLRKKPRRSRRSAPRRSCSRAISASRRIRCTRTACSRYTRGLMAQGVSAADIDVMSRKNPARLLGLQPTD